MCLEINKKRHFRKTTNSRGKLVCEAFVADRPLVIKKRVRVRKIDALRFTYRSPYYDSLIVMKKEYSCTMEAHAGWSDDSVEQGFHGYLMSANQLDWNVRASLTRSDIHTIFGVIPAGAKYYVGNGKEVVSNKVMYFETLEEIADYFNVKKLADPYTGEYTTSGRDTIF